MADDTSKQTEATLVRHLEAFGQKNIEAILNDYTDDSVIFTANGPVRGLDHIRQFFEDFVKNMEPGFAEAFKMKRQDVDGGIAYIVWSAAPFIQLGTDTFVVQDGKIMVQTFAAHKPS